MSNAVKARWIGDDFNALLREEDAERARERPHIEITDSMIRRLFDELRRIGAEVTYAVTGTIIDYADAKTALDIAVNGDSL